MLLFFMYFLFSNGNGLLFRDNFYSFPLAASLAVNGIATSLQSQHTGLRCFSYYTREIVPTNDKVGDGETHMGGFEAFKI